MNHNSHYISSPQHAMSTGTSYAPHSQTAGMSHYPSYHQHHPQTTNTYHGASSYGYPYGGTTTAYSTSQPTSVSSSLLPFSLASSAPSQHSYHPHPQYAPGSHQPVHTFDTTGQIPPPNYQKPKMTATLWEDEGTLCFQVEARGVTVARREDSGYINGTKLLNVAGMTRGRRDGILKSEKNRNVVKIGPMHLKGVWIPYEKALDFANKEKITDVLYPLFVHNVAHIIMSNGNQPGDHLRNLDSNRFRARIKNSPSGAGMNNSIPSQIAPSPLNAITQLPGSRPSMERSHTFPTPPTSASSVGGGQNSSYDWNTQNMGTIVQNAPSLAIDTSSSNSRSLPNTPASTPPSNTVQSLQQPYHTTATMNQYTMQQPVLSRYGQANQYIKNEMGPPSKASTSIGEADQPEIKQDPYNQSSSEQGDTSQDDGYARGGYMNYTGIMDHAIASPDQVNGSPHQSASGRGTPRTSTQQWNHGYNTPNRSSTGYNETPVSSTHGNSSYSAASYTPTSLTNGKRAREEDECDYKPQRSVINNDADSIKRRRGGTESSVSSSMSPYDQSRLQSGNNILTSRIR